MIIKGLIDEDFVQYKKPSMTVMFPKCDFKCEKECGKQVCQNSALVTSPNISISIRDLVDRYSNNNLTSAIVCGGLEPIDSFDDLIQLVNCFRLSTDDDIVIFTGYYREEIREEIEELSAYKNIIVKFGRFIPRQEKHYDDVLGVLLASDNQYAERLVDNGTYKE